MIRIPQFEGPLGLLLSLVERRRLPITELSLASVADQYLQQVRASQGIDRETLSEFLLTAARLVLLKSRALLPRLPREQDTEVESVEDLLRRLESYRAFRLLAREFGRCRGPRAFPRGMAQRVVDVAPRMLAPLAAERLAATLQRVATAYPEPAHDELRPLARIAVADRIVVVRERMRGRYSMDWDLTSSGSTDEVVATLLALLELVRRGELRVEQTAPFGPIRLHRVGEPAVAHSGRAGVR